MAKKKQKKSLLPKRIAGVKVPKAVRKGRLGELLASRAGQALIAEAVMAAGAMAGAKKAGKSPKVRNLAGYAADRLQQLGDGATHKGKDMGEAGATLAYALGEAARSFVDALNQQREEPRSFTAERTPPIWTAEGDAEPAGSQASGASSKKKPAASPSSPP